MSNDLGSDIQKLLSQAVSAEKDGKLEFAETLLLAALEEAEHSETDEQLLYITLEQLAELYWSMGKFRHAEKAARRLYDAYLKRLGAEHFDVGVAAQNLAMVYHRQQKYGQAEPLYKQAMSIKAKVLGGQHPDIAQVMENYADLLQTTHRAEEAAHMMVCIRGITTGKWTKTGRMEALASDVQKQTTAAPPPTNVPAVKQEANPTENDWNALQASAKKMCDAGDYQNACEFLFKAIQLAEKLESERKLAWSLDRLGEMLCHLEKYGQAEMAWQRSLQIKKDVLGNFHDEVVFTSNCLARLHYLLGRYAEAEAFGKECLAIYEHLRGSEHCDVASSLQNLATLYHVRGLHKEAEQCYARALRIRQTLLGEDHPDTRKTAKNYADLLTVMSREEEARALDAKATGLITGNWTAYVADEDELLT